MNHIAAIHTLKTQLQLDDGDYRALLRQLTTKDSCGRMTRPELLLVRTHFDKLAGHAGVGRPAQPRGARFAAAEAAASPLERKVWALWGELGRSGVLDAPGAAGLRAFVKRQTNVDDLKFCSQGQLHALVESLKKWGQRAS